MPGPAPPERGDAVQWIEPPLPPLSATVDSSRAAVQANAAQAVPYGLSGAGVEVMGRKDRDSGAPGGVWWRDRLRGRN